MDLVQRFQCDWLIDLCDYSFASFAEKLVQNGAVFEPIVFEEVRMVTIDPNIRFHSAINDAAP